MCWMCLCCEYSHMKTTIRYKWFIRYYRTRSFSNMRSWVWGASSNLCDNILQEFCTNTINSFSVMPCGHSFVCCIYLHDLHNNSKFYYYMISIIIATFNTTRFSLSELGFLLVLRAGHVVSLNHGTTKDFVEVLVSTYLTVISSLKGVCSNIPRIIILFGPPEKG